MRQRWPRGQSRRAALALGGLGALALLVPGPAPSARAADEPSAPGSYCALPEGDEPPACLEPATRRYPGFFGELRGEGEVSEDAAAAVEAGLAGEDRYAALSSLAYAYYLLSRRSAANPAVDPRLRERLERWNALLGRTYRASEDEGFRRALRAAAGDLADRAPPVPVRCTDAQGRVVECESTRALARALGEARQRTGLRGALTDLVERIFGGDG